MLSRLLLTELERSLVGARVDPAVALLAKKIIDITLCPEIIAAIGHLPETLADRCILIRRCITKADVEELKLRTSPPPSHANSSNSNASYEPS